MDHEHDAIPLLAEGGELRRRAARKRESVAARLVAPIRALLSRGAFETLNGHLRVDPQDLFGPKGPDRKHAAWLGMAGLVFVLAQILSLAHRGDCFFGLLTGGAVESLTHRAHAPAIRWHVFAAIPMWALGFGQITLRVLRHRPWAWVHRWAGRATLALWLFIVAPTAAYLALFCKAGPAGAAGHVAGVAFAVVSLDTAAFGCWYFLAGLAIGRTRRRGAASLALHGRLMRAGLLCTCTILFQRPLQMGVIAARAALAAAGRDGRLPASMAGLLLRLAHCTLLEVRVCYRIARMRSSLRRSRVACSRPRAPRRALVDHGVGHHGRHDTAAAGRAAPRIRPARVSHHRRARAPRRRQRWQGLAVGGLAPWGRR